MLSSYLLSLDQGTSSSRAIIFKRNGEIFGSHQLEHTQMYPSAGQVEHDPEEIWKNCVLCMSTVMEKCCLVSSDIAAIGVTNQRETTIVWDKTTGKPYHNAIVWNDTRTVDICKRLSFPDKNRFQATTGLPMDCYFSLSKLVYLLETIPGLRAAAESGQALFGTVDSYLLWKLSSGAVHCTDVTNASRTMMMNLSTLAWDEEILHSCGIPKAMLPSILPSVGEFCKCSAIDSLRGVPVSAVLGDQQAALFGQGCFSPGEAKCTYGTGAFLLVNTGEEIVQSSYGLLTTVAFQIAGNKPFFALEGSVKYCGSVVQWLRDNIELLSHASESEAIARQVSDNGGVYFVPAFAGLGAPDWDDTARGTIIGLTAFNTKAHIVRAALEAAAYQVRQVLDASTAGHSDTRGCTVLKVDGGMTANSLLMQFQSDVLGVPLVLPFINETTALGVALAAGLAHGLYESLEDIRAIWRAKCTYSPSEDEGSYSAKASYVKWLSAVERSRKWLV